MFQSLKGLSASPQGFQAFQHPVFQPREPGKQVIHTSKIFRTANLENYSNKILSFKKSLKSPLRNKIQDTILLTHCTEKAQLGQ